jgi:uncharacterized protein YdaU (DUF1376 family)
MHTYDFHIGDYARDTGHLSLLEHGVYRLLLDRLYSDEAPLPLDITKLTRKLGAKTTSEQNAVATVLDEFFHQTPEGYTHKRVIQELSEARLRALKSKYSQVMRWWRHNKWPHEPTLDTYIANPSAYHDPHTGHIRQPAAASTETNGSNTTVYDRNTKGDKRNSYQPPTANRQLPTANRQLPTAKEIKTPLIPQGGDIDPSASPAPQQTDTLELQHDESEAIPPQKRKGGRARLEAPEFPDDLPHAYRDPLTTWFNYKRQVGKGYVDTGWAALVARERKFTPADVAESVQASLANGYTGLFTADMLAKLRNLPSQKKETGAAPTINPITTPDWDWLTLATTLWPQHNLHNQRWQDLPASTRHDLRQAHQKGLPA